MTFEIAIRGLVRNYTVIIMVKMDTELPLIQNMNIVCIREPAGLFARAHALFSRVSTWLRLLVFD